MNKKSILFLLIFIVASCATQYRVVYDTYLEKSDNKSLTFQDENFYFEFLPVPNGVYFKIKNLTTKPAVLIWDRSYFIEPDNNSYKLLNTDILHEEEETRRKTKYESMLPPGAFFSRFTTSAVNVDKFLSIKNKKVSSYFEIYNIDFLTTSTEVEYQTFLSYGRYWPEIGKIKTSKLDKELNRIKQYVLTNNSMGIGFGIKSEENILDYKFDFKFKRVTVHKVKQEGGTTFTPEVTEKLELKAAMDESNGWEWKIK